MIIPAIETDCLKLIPPSLDSVELYETFYADQEASAFYGGPLTKEQVWARLKADLGAWHLLGFGVWVIQMKSEQCQVGTCGFWQGRDWPVELTWWVLPEHRGKGIATEASVAELSYAYNVLGWDKVETYMDDENVAASALAARLGGVKSHRERFPDGLHRTIFHLPKPT